MGNKNKCKIFTPLILPSTFDFDIMQLKPSMTNINIIGDNNNPFLIPLDPLKKLAGETLINIAYSVDIPQDII